MDIGNMRKDYSGVEFEGKYFSESPLSWFATWFLEAKESGEEEPNAMALATVSEKGTPACRMVLLKSFDQDGFVFFTNYESRKGQHLAANPSAALLFFWKNLARQLRVEGKVEKTQELESDQYFISRPIDNQINAIISAQSREIKSRDEILDLRKNLSQSMDEIPLRRPEFWGGYRLKPELFEFWQGQPGRLHDRIQFRLFQNGWEHTRLAP
jgi:pyridoxamine 5'-phosphate oxidase